jgi:predicted TPR repeat methyltransferase
MNWLIEKLRAAYRARQLSNYEIELAKAVGDCQTLLDVGCGSASPIRSFSQKLHCVGVDAFAASIEKSRKKGLHNEYHELAVLDIGQKFKPRSFDCVLAADLIEHLTKEDGLKLMAEMEKIAKSKVILFTPNGFLPQGEYDNNPWQIHRSGWTVKEMEARGYKVIGINGWKPLKGEYAEIRFWPKVFWANFSELTQLFVRNKPENAFHLLCVKTVQRPAQIKH